MAIAETYTLLSLDRFARAIGFDPLHFNQITSALRPRGTCSDVLFQNNWNNPAQVGREEIARAIEQAETDIANYVNYWPLPKWIIDERQPTSKPARPELYNWGGVNARWQAQSVPVRYGHFVQGGQRAQTLIEANSNLTYSDPDSDGFDELATAMVNTSVTEPCEVRAYFPAQNGSDAYELRPINVTLAGGVATITANRWQLADPSLWYNFAAAVIDGDDDTNFITEIDVYRVYNDPQLPVTFLWENPLCSCGGVGCPECVFSAQNGCIHARDERLGEVFYRPATWNADTAQFDSAEFTYCRAPDKLRLWYLAGYQDNRQSCPRLQMSGWWERTIAMLALAYLHGDVCDCSAVKTLFNWAQTDLALNDGNANLSYQTAQRVLACPFGTKRGAVEAFARINNEGIKLPR